QLDNATNKITTIAANHTGSISYTDANDLTVGSVTDTAMSMSSTSTGITSNGYDVKLSTVNGALSIESPVTLGGGHFTRNPLGDAMHTGSLTAAVLHYTTSFRSQLDNATNKITTIAANHTGSISYTDADDLTVGSVTDTAMSLSSTSTGLTSNGYD